MVREEKKRLEREERGQGKERREEGLFKPLKF